MWTQEQCRTYGRDPKGLPSNLTDQEWAVFEPLSPSATPGRRPRKTDIRETMKAIFECDFRMQISLFCGGGARGALGRAKISVGVGRSTASSTRSSGRLTRPKAGF
jgi:hypothetical protein